MSTAVLSPLLPRGRPLLRVAAATTLTVTAFALLNPVLAVRLHEEAVSSTAIGFLAMLPFLTVATLVPWMPWLFKHRGVPQTLRLGLLLELAATLGYTGTQDYTLRCLCAVVGGAGAAAVWNATEALIAHNAPAAQRGRLTSLYQTALGAGMALGPLLPSVIRLSPWALTWVAAALIALGWALCWGSAVSGLRAGAADHPALDGLWQAIQRSPDLMMLAFVGGVFEIGLSSLITAFGAQSGLSLAAATSLAGALGLGSFALQYPCGWLADRWPMRRVLRAAGTLLLLASLGFALGPWWGGAWWVSAFVWGGVGGALYTFTMIRVAQAGGNTVSSTAVVITGYTLGGTLGPLISGLVLDLTGATGQILWLGLLSCGVIIIAARRPTHTMPG